MPTANYLKVQPGDAAAREHLVHLLMASEKYDEALAEMEKAEKGGTPSLESLQAARRHSDRQKKCAGSDCHVATSRGAGSH